MTYKETLDYLYNSLPMYQRIGGAAYKADLNNTIALMNAMGNPYQHYRTVHIAGTNGKGSVSHNLASLAMEANYKTGLYTSPHLKDFRERIRVDGKKISRQYVVDFVEKYKDLFEQIKPSFFEMTVAMAFCYFADQNVSLAFVEVGMGGRLDSTNVIHPQLSIITNISYDHTQYLGDTLQKIAAEKAGIIKENTPVIIGETQEEVKDVFIKIAQERNAPIVFADQFVDIVNIRHYEENNMFWTCFDVTQNKRLIYKDVCSPLSGCYQIKNFKSVIVAAILAGDNFIHVESVCNGFKHCIENTHLKGRWQCLGRNPLIIADTAHNKAGLEQVCQQIATMKFDRLHFIISVVNDKDLDSILPLLPKKAIYYFCKAKIQRGLPADMLQRIAANYNLKGKTYTSIYGAFRAARKNAAPNDMIFVGGSTFTVAEVVLFYTGKTKWRIDFFEKKLYFCNIKKFRLTHD